jgi:hypothetical protein
MLFMFCGALGLSSQISLLLDIIYYLTLPTRLIYKLLAYIYSRLVIVIPILYEFITKDSQSWISCVYPKWMMGYYFRLAGIVIIILLAGFMGVVVGYYLWVVGLVMAVDMLQVLTTFIFRSLFTTLGFSP